MSMEAHRLALCHPAALMRVVNLSHYKVGVKQPTASGSTTLSEMCGTGAGTCSTQSVTMTIGSSVAERSLMTAEAFAHRRVEVAHRG